MIIEDPELLKEFVVESQEHLSDVENQLLTLESQGSAMDVALVNKVFRAVHSIKGAAGFLGLTNLCGLAHREEEVLNRMRSGELAPDSVVINVLLRATDCLKQMIDTIETSNEIDVSEHITHLEQVLQGTMPMTAAAPPPSAVATPIAAPPAAATAQAPEATAVAVAPPPRATSGGGRPTPAVSPEAMREFLVESYDNLEQLERDLMSLERDPCSDESLSSVFRTVHTIKGTAGFLGFGELERLTHASENLLGSLRAGEIRLDAEISGGLFAVIDLVRRMLSTIEETGTEGNADVGELTTQLTRLHDDKLKHRTVAASQRTEAPLLSQPPAPPQNPVVPAAPATPAKPAAAASESASASADGNGGSVAESTIRVDVALLDKLMTRVGELVLARNQILQFTGLHGDSALQGTSQRLNLITTELQEGVMKTRMQPIGNVWTKFPRLVRDLAVVCGKQVRIEMEGKETELDKTIIEAIKDPLTHLVRNTVDHGIEPPGTRVAAGKPAEGCLTLRAFHEGGQVNIEILDDGAGLNLERIKQKALEKGLVTADQVGRMGDRELAQLIFLPGFSTAEKVSNVSGRGVGMDVVKTNIEKIGGTVDLQSQAGLGTTIRIKIPLTLAIIPALVVTADNDRYAIPQVNLLELVRLEGDQVQRGIEWIQGAPVYRLRGRLLPLVYLRRELQLADAAESRDVVNIVVLRADDRQFGLVVDRINDTEEIVVKPLSKQLKGVSVYSGATIMGDGRVALILDVLGLAHSAHVVSEGRDRAVSDNASRAHDRTSQCQTLLVLGVGPTRRLALPISLVARLEQIAPTVIERADNREVVQYRGEILPLIRLASVLGVPEEPRDENCPYQVVVYSENGRSVGLVVDRIVDIVEANLDIQCRAHGHGLLGSAVIQQHVTDLLDLPAIIRQVDPLFFEEQAV